MLLPPGRLSIITCWPSAAYMRGCIARATRSVAPPGGNPTIIRTGFVGYACACAALIEASKTTGVAITKSNLRIACFFSTNFDLVSTETGQQHIMFQDSTYALPVASGKLIAYYESRKGKEGTWIIPADYRENPSHAKPMLIEKNDNVLKSLVTLEYFCYENKQHEWWRYNYQSGKRERLNISFPGLEQGSQGTLSDDGEELVYIVRKLSAKLVMIENMFQ